MALVIVSDKARHDGRDIIELLSNKAGRNTAAHYIQNFQEIFDRLSSFPQSGAKRENLGSEIRIMVTWPYVIFYRYQTDNDTVYVLRIVHGSQNIKPHDVI